MFTTANRLIVGTGNVMLLRNLKGPRAFWLSGGAGECVIAGNGIFVAEYVEGEEPEVWSEYLLADFGEANQLKEIVVWVKPNNSSPQYLPNGDLDSIRRLEFISTGR